MDSLRTPPFALCWLAQAISRLGDPITLIAFVANAGAFTRLVALAAARIRLVTSVR